MALSDIRHSISIWYVYIEIVYIYFLIIIIRESFGLVSLEFHSGFFVWTGVFCPFISITTIFITLNLRCWKHCVYKVIIGVQKIKWKLHMKLLAQVFQLWAIYWCLVKKKICFFFKFREEILCQLITLVMVDSITQLHYPLKIITTLSVHIYFYWQ